MQTFLNPQYHRSYLRALKSFLDGTGKSVDAVFQRDTHVRLRSQTTHQGLDSPSSKSQPGPGFPQPKQTKPTAPSEPLDPPISLPADFNFGNHGYLLQSDKYAVLVFITPPVSHLAITHMAPYLRCSDREWSGVEVWLLMRKLRKWRFRFFQQVLNGGKLKLEKNRVRELLKNDPNQASGQFTIEQLDCQLTHKIQQLAPLRMTRRAFFGSNKSLRSMPSSQ